MSLEKSRWINVQTEPNPWREIDVSQEILLNALDYILRQGMTKVLKKNEVIERVLVGEPVNGVYPLSIAIIKKGGNVIG